IKDSGGNVVCTTNTITVTVNPAATTCQLTLNGSTADQTVNFGDTGTWAITSSPSELGSASCRAKDGSPDVSDALAGTTPYSLSYAQAASGIYTRYAKIKDSGGNVVCATNTITVTVNPAATTCQLTLNGSTADQTVNFGDTGTWVITSSPS